MITPSIVPIAHLALAPRSGDAGWQGRRSCPTASLLAAALTLCLAGCGGSAEPGGLNIVVITMDTTRADHLGSYGSPLKLTPHVDALAERGVLFTQAYAPMPQTLPAHATLFTGLAPRDHGALENTYTLNDGYTTLAEICAERGYATGAFIGSLAVDDLTGIQQGFERFDQPGGDWGEGRQGHPPQRKAKAVTSAALSWVEQQGGAGPFMLWAHYYDPHGDANKSFEPPERHLKAVSRDQVRAQVEARAGRFREVAGVEALTDYWWAYAAEIRFTDEQIGRLLAGLEDQGLLENTIVVVVGDHGEGLYEHGQKAHGTHLWEEMMRVPLVLAAPDGAGAGTRLDEPVTLSDLLPTIERMAFGADHGLPRVGEGLDLWSPAVAGGTLPDRPVFLERPHFEEKRLLNRARGQAAGEFTYGYLTAIVQGRQKLIRHPDGSSQLFDLEADPGELTDISAEQPERAARLVERLEGWMSAHKVSEPGTAEVSEELWAKMKALGYVGDDDVRPGS